MMDALCPEQPPARFSGFPEIAHTVPCGVSTSQPQSNSWSPPNGVWPGTELAHPKADRGTVVPSRDIGLGPFVRWEGIPMTRLVTEGIRTSDVV